MCRTCRFCKDKTYLLLIRRYISINCDNLCHKCPLTKLNANMITEVSTCVIVLSFMIAQLRLVGDKYLLLTELEGRTVSYGPSFFPIDLLPALAIKVKSTW